MNNKRKPTDLTLGEFSRKIGRPLSWVMDNVPLDYAINHEWYYTEETFDRVLAAYSSGINAAFCKGGSNAT